MSRDGRRLSPTGTCYECGRPVSGERRFCGPHAAKKENATRAFPVACPCGWTGATRPYAYKAREAIARHQDGPACPDSPNYVPEHERDALRRKRQRDAARRRNEVAPGEDCTILDGRPCACVACQLAAKDHQSPLALGGRWVAKGGIRKWVAA